MSEAVTYYHGGAPGLTVGQRLLPPDQTGAPSCSEYGGAAVHRRDRVYVATVFEAALIFAAGHPSQRGCVYECEPVGALEPDPDCDLPGLSWQCEAARIVRVHKVKPKRLAQVRRVAFGPPILARLAAFR